jgi:hypothetical protein
VTAWKHLRAGLLWFAAYVLVSCALSWPTASLLGRAVPQGAEPSATVALFNLWTYEWNARCATRGYRGYWDAPILFPVRGTFAMSDPQPLTGLVFAVLQWLTGDPVFAFGLLLLLTLAANGLAAYVLLRTLGLDVGPAGLGGVLAIGLPFVAQELGALQLVVLAPPLLALAALARLVSEPRLRFGAALGLAVAATFLTSEYYGVFLAALLPLSGVLVTRRTLPRLLPALLLAAALAALLVAPVALHQHHVLGPGHDARVVEKTSARLHDWIQVGPQGLLAKLGLLPVRETERQGFGLFPGGVLLGVALAGVLRLFRQPPGPRRWWLFVGLGLGALFLLGFGTNLSVAGWTPFAFLQRWIPGFRTLRNAYRAAVFVQLLLLLTAAVGLQCIWRSRRGLGPALATLLVLLGLLETRVDAVPMYAPPADLREAAWVQHLRTLPSGPVVMVPIPAVSRDMRVWTPVTLQMLQGLVFDKPLLQGYSGYVTEEYQRLADWFANFPDRSSVGAAVLYGARYVVIDPDWLTVERRAALTSLASAFQVAYDGPDRLILEIVTPLSAEGRRRRPPQWHPHPGDG